MKLSTTPLCERCALAGVDTWATTVDHRIPVEQRPDLRLCMENLESQCDYHHDVVKQREESAFRASGKPPWLEPSLVPLVIVCGPVASGKSTYCAHHAGARDLIIDLDVIGSRLSGLPFTHDWNRHHLDAALRERNALLGALAKGDAPTRWARAWLIVSEPTSEGRAWWQEKLEPDAVVVLETPPGLCIERARGDRDRDGRMDMATQAIGEWWQRYEPRDGETIVRPCPSGM